jgi:aryl-alcohol dehydrogenase-like predicted oxidoreductase
VDPYADQESQLEYRRAVLAACEETVERLARDLSVSLTRYSIAWTLAQPAMTSAILGAKRIEQLEDAVAATEVSIPEDHFSRIDALSPRPWQQPDPVRS